MRSEWAVGSAWLGANSGAMLLATAYVLLAGSHLEWCIIQRTRRLVRPHVSSDVSSNVSSNVSANVSSNVCD